MVPADKVSNDVGMADDHFNAALLLRRLSPVKVVSESCLYSGAVTIKLLKLT